MSGGGGVTVAVPAAGFSPATILARLLTVDGAGSGLDADLLDGQSGSYYRDAGNINAGTLAVARGGTGLASYAVGDILYADGATSLAKLAGVATGNALISGGVTTAPSWGKIGLTTHVDGILPSANGGTGVNNAGTLTNASNTTITGGGTLALAGFTLTVPATGTVGLLGTAQTWSAQQTLTLTPIVSALTASRLVRTNGSKELESNAALTAGRVLFVDANGWPTDSANITFSTANGLVVAGSVSEQTLRCGSFGIQNYAVGNSWFGENTYFNGSAFVYRSNGDAGMVRWNSESWQIQAAVAGTAGASASFAEMSWNSSSVLTIGSSSAGQIIIPKTTGISVILTSADGASLRTDGGIAIKDGITAPSATVGYAKLFVDTADGDLKVIFGDGTTKTIVTDT